jgi:hypothetical protein
MGAVAPDGVFKRYTKNPGLQQRSNVRLVHVNHYNDTVTSKLSVNGYKTFIKKFTT